MLVSPNHPILIKPDGSLAIGVCDKDARKIYIKETLNDHDFKKVLCHELVHAAMFSYDFYLKPKQEEFIAEIITLFGEEVVDITDMIFAKLKE